MMDIEKISRVKRETLDSQQYFQSLLEKAYEFEMLSGVELEKIQFGCLALLGEKTERYNSGESSSIRIEKAQDILNSIMFTIGVQLKTYQSPDDAITALCNENVDRIYQMGYKQIEQLVKHAKKLQSTIRGHLLQTENEFYDATIVDGINGFFQLYYPEFEAHEIHITADYPVHQQVEGLQGIEFIGKYLEHIYYENEFCTQFLEEDVHHLLCGYDDHYQSLLFNIYEVVLTSAMGCILTDGDFRSLERDPSSTQLLTNLFARKSKTEIEEVLVTALKQLCEALELPNPLQQYLNGSLSLIAASVENAVLLQRLDQAFLLPKYPQNNPKLIVSFGEKMEDEKYRKVLDEIMQCRYFTDKKALIKSKIHSLADLEDVLLDAELYEDEILSILAELSFAEIAALVKKHPLPSDLDKWEMRDSEILLCECLYQFLAALPQKQQMKIQTAISMLDRMYT